MPRTRNSSPTVNVRPPITLGALADRGYDLVAHCPRCGRTVRMDPLSILARHRRAISIYRRMSPIWLARVLRCRRCGRRVRRLRVRDPARARPPRRPRFVTVSVCSRRWCVNPRGRDFVVGDVHGCFRTLERALRGIGFDPRTDRLFGVGDLVNRGPHSEEALGWLEQCFDAVVLGNHDRSVLSWFRARPGSKPPAGSGWLLDLSRRDHPRWRAALEDMPLAITIETAHGLIGIVHAEAPHHSWVDSLRLLGTASPSVIDDALLGLEASPEAIRRHRTRPVEGLRALVHGHEPVERIACIANRWNIDTGAGIARLDRLSLVKVNAPEFRAWTFDVDESC